MWLLLIIAVALLWFFSQSKSGGVSQAGQNSPTTSANPIDQFTQAWARFEGFNLPGSRAQRNNNPVNLVGGNYTGVVGQDPEGFDIFTSPEAGFAAAQGYVQRNAQNNPGWNFGNFFGKVLGNLLGQPVNNDQGDSDQLAANVAGTLRVTADTNLNDYLAGSDL